MSLVADYTDSDENSDGGGVDDNSSPTQSQQIRPLRKSADVGESEDDSSADSNSQESPGEGSGNNFLIPAAGSESSDSDDDANHDGRGRSRIKPKLSKLDNPFRTFGDVNVAKEDSVFRNPFRDKEEERIAVLERHVKMTENPETALTINGKKICWNYRKRKCYLGTQCPYAHDSDVPLTEEQLKEQKIENDLHRAGLVNSNTIGVGIKPVGKTHLPGTASNVAGGYDSSAFFSSPHLGGHGHTNKEDRNEDEESSAAPSSSSRKRVRVGLRNGLVPPKKALQLYNTTKDKKC